MELKSNGVIWWCGCHSSSVSPALCCMLSGWMCVCWWIDMCWQPGSLHQNIASLSDRRLTEWWVEEQQSGKWEERGRKKRRRRERGAEVKEGKLRFWEGWIKKKGQCGCDCACDMWWQRRGEEDGWTKGRRQRRAVTKTAKTEEADLIATVGVFVLRPCASRNWCRWLAGCNKKCDLLIGCRKMSELSMQGGGGVTKQNGFLPLLLLCVFHLHSRLLGFIHLPTLL